MGPASDEITNGIIIGVPKFSIKFFHAIMRFLNVAEKPSMARQIASCLSDGKFTTSDGVNKFCKNFQFSCKVGNTVQEMIMTSVLGHLSNIDFSSQYSNWHKVDPEALFQAEIIESNLQDTVSILKNLQNLAGRCEALVIWTDCDREGEYIGDEIKRACLKSNAALRIYRARYSAVTRAELFRSLNNLGALDDRIINAVLVRMELDLRSGVVFTRTLTMKLKERFQALNNNTISYGKPKFAIRIVPVPHSWVYSRATL